MGTLNELLQRKVSNKFDLYRISYGSLVDMVGPNKLNTYPCIRGIRKINDYN